MTDEAFARVLIAGKHLDEAALERARKLQREKHPTLDLANVLVRHKILDRTQIALALRLAKMSSGSARTPDASHKTPAPTPSGAAKLAAAAKMAAPVSELDTRPLGPFDAGAAAVSNGAPESKTGPEPADTATAKTAVGLERVIPLPPDEKTGEKSVARWKRAQDKTHFGRYEVVEKIAKGGMGIVFKVRHPELGRLFALKVLSQGEDASEEVLERFRREAKTAARLDHPSIVRVHDAGTEDGFPYIVMDLVQGDTLSKIVKEEGVTPRKAALIARSIARALGHAHAQGVVHRDVKPDNVLIDRATGDAKLSDFGIVKDLAGESDARLTRTGLTLGSPCYMSPEQAAGRHKDVGPCSDIYSLGATLYEALAGRPPFDGDSIHEIMVKVVNEETVPPHKLNPAVSPELEAICLKSLEKEPSRRYLTALAFEQDLERYVEGKPVLARPASLASKVWRTIKRHRTPAAFAALVVLGVGYATGNKLVETSRERRERSEKLESQLALAESSLAVASKPDTGEFDTRRAYREAIRRFDAVLEGSPTNTRARDGKRKAIFGLADRLLERREPGFAEFVLDQAEGLADPAEIASRQELARQSEWVHKAEAAELAGDLEEALRLNKEGLRALKQAGLAGDQLAEKVKELETDLARRRREDQVKALIETADRHDASGELTLALDTLQRALAIDNDYLGLKQRIDFTDRRLRRQAEEAVEAAMSERDRAHVAQPEGAVARPELGNALEKADALFRAARERLEANDLGSALDNARAAQVNYKIAVEIATALAAREYARSARTGAERSDTSKFATAEMAKAQEQFESGEAQVTAGDYGRARTHFQQAAKLYRIAASTGASKQTVSTAHEAARNAKMAALAELPNTITLRSVREAQALEADAQKAEEKGESGRATDLWTKAGELWTQARESAGVATAALNAREHALKQKTDADTEQGGEFDADDMQLAQRNMDEGDSALAREDFPKATNAYGQAEYRWRQAAMKSSPISRPKKHTEQIRKAAEEARDRAAAAGKVDTHKYEDAAKYFAMGEEAEKRRYWHGADDYYTRARSMFESLAPQDK